MSALHAQHQLERLSREQCVALMGTQKVGRLVVVEHGRPLVFPVNYALDGEAPVFRTASGAKLWASSHSPVAFEVDSLDVPSQTGWSVIVHGMAHEVTAFDRTDLQFRVAGLDIRPWATGDKPLVVRVEPRMITGRRIGL